MEKNHPGSEDVQECLKHTGRHKPNKTIVSKIRMLEAVEGGQGDLPCYQILKCAVASSSPIYNPLEKDERATEQLEGLRPAGEDMRSYLQTTCKFLLIFVCLLWKSGEEFSDNRQEFNFSSPLPIPSALTELGYFFSCKHSKEPFMSPLS